MASNTIDSAFFRDLFGSLEMRDVFSDEALLQRWLDYESALAAAEASLGLIPKSAAEEIARKAKAHLMDKAIIKQGIDETVHPLISVIRQLSAKCDGDAGFYVHWGATTQDVMDTALVLQIKDAYVIFERDIVRLIQLLSAMARKHRNTTMAGRTHGQQALPITFGFKVAVWISELKRHLERLKASRQRVLVGEFAGAVGTLASVGAVGLEIQKHLMDELGLKVPEIAWHTSRDNMAEFATIVAMIAATLGKIAHEVIDLQKSEFAEVEEPFQPGKIGSSTMPQKRNPMLCESILTLARLTRRHTTTAIDAMLHEHERDWSSFQMEWAYLPDLCVMAHGAMTLTLRVVEGLQVNEVAMARNLKITRGLLLSERVMLALARYRGRQAAHDIVYEAAMKAYENGEDFAEVLKKTEEIVAHLDGDMVDELLDPATYTGLAGEFVDRVVSDVGRVSSNTQGKDPEL